MNIRAGYFAPLSARRLLLLGGMALVTAALMQQGRVVDWDVALALRAAKIGNDLKLPLA